MTIRDLASLATHLRAHPATFRDAVHRHFFAALPDARQSFPMDASQAHRGLAESFAAAFDAPDLDEYFADLGRSHRRHGFPADTYPIFATATRQALAEIDLADDVLQQAGALVDDIVECMSAAAHEADVAGIPPAHMGQVVDVERVDAHTRIVRLECGLPVDYEPGQYFSVATTLMPGVWRTLAAARPADGCGTLEFHVRDVSLLPGASGYSRRFMMTRPGDQWTLGNPAGQLELDPQRESLIIAFGTAVATLRCLLFAAFDAHGEQHAPVQALVINDFPGQHYELATLSSLDNLTPWLDVHAFARHDSDPHWLKPQRSRHRNLQRALADGQVLADDTGGSDTDSPASSASLSVAENPEETIAHYRDWSDHDVFVLGPETEVNGMLAAFAAAGLDPDTVQTQSWGRTGVDTAPTAKNEQQKNQRN
ncbi:hypothetical protein [Corynebacterium pseudodiphtheriticum]|uniref:hypothetical protein n=1 Tax=Corynebacterium pseudodiphtheriticum TaxID=37637 RepID=UPI002549F615|nr:hypothetical protein [Corynebacterium pseudodiphtheriticum]MDK8563676.1 hypothetical protein [Corynebacterium pseudodiphtheriticum]